MSGTLDAATLVELQAALRAGAGAGEALTAAVRAGPLATVAAEVRLGRSLRDVAADVDTGDAAADFLVRCLGLAERTGTGAAQAVAGALGGIREEARIVRLLRTRTTQARGTALILAVLPLVVWAGLVALDGGALRFYGTPAGVATGACAVILAGTAWRWMQALIRRAAAAAASADPLTVDAARSRRRGGRTRPAGTAETVSLLAIAVEAGLPASGALAEAAAVAPPGVRPVLAAASARTTGGWSCADALDATPLAPVGRILHVAQRWGAPAGPALREFAAELHEDRRAAVDAASERLQLTLVFPTTLLTLPAFILAVVPPLLWSTLRG